jgi:outer membrane protein assembly factor BamB
MSIVSLRAPFSVCPFIVGLFLFSVVAATPGFAEDWTEFRGPTGQGHARATGLPVRWSENENVAWKKRIEGKGWSSPILLNGRIYLTTAVPLDSQNAPAQNSDIPDAAQSLRVLCLDATSGDLVWNVEVFRQPAGAKIHAKNSHASPTPITDGRRLFVHFGTFGTASLDLDGKVLWRNDQLTYDPRHGSGGSPVLVDDILFISCDGFDVQFVAALDQENGKIRWRIPRSTKPVKGFSFGTPLVIEASGRKQIVSSGSDAVIAYQPADGAEIWKVGYSVGYSVVPRPVYGNGLLFVCTGYDTPRLLAIKPDGAAGDVTETNVVWQTNKNVPANPSPLLIDDALYMVSDHGILSCLEAQTGRRRWEQRIRGAYSASPVYADGKIYLQSEEGEGVVVRPGLKFEELGRSSMGEKTLASYAIGDGALFIRSQGHLARVQVVRDERTGPGKN